MATLQDPIPPVLPTDVNSDANRLARLQASGGSPTAIANLQAAVVPTTAPVSPTPVSPTPTTPVAPVQAPIPQPIDQTTGLSKPLAPSPASPASPVQTTPVAQTTPTPTKTEPVVDYNV